MTATEVRQQYAAVFGRPIELSWDHDRFGRALKPREFRKLEEQYRRNAEQ